MLVEVDATESRKLSLLTRAHAVLQHALNSLGGKKIASPTNEYLQWQAVFCNRLMGGYLLLRKSQHCDSSKILIRPAIESVFNAAAAIKGGEVFLLQKKYTEIKEEQTLFSKGSSERRQLDACLVQLENKMRGKGIQLKRLKMNEIADMATKKPSYECAYGIYCKHTHGALRAIKGGYNEATDVWDSWVMAWCSLQFLKLLKENTDAQVKGFDGLAAELNQLVPSKA